MEQVSPVGGEARFLTGALAAALLATSVAEEAGALQLQTDKDAAKARKKVEKQEKKTRTSIDRLIRELDKLDRIYVDSKMNCGSGRDCM